MTGLFMAGAFNGLTGAALLRQAYDGEAMAHAERSLTLLPPVTEEGELEARAGELKAVDVIFSTWGMFPLERARIDRLFPRLKALFYAAGTVRSFARPFLERGVRVFSAASVNAVPVAEYAAAQIVLANKGFFQASARYRTAGWSDARDYYGGMPGNFGARVGILGAGAIGRQVIRLLRAYDLPVLVFDPFLSGDAAEALGVQKASLETVFSSCGVISNHLADNAHTRGLLDYRLFSRMSPRAVFLNTGRGAQVAEPDLVRALAEEPGRTAVLDVTVDEPVPAGHPFLKLPNVFLTPHIAGSSGSEIARMGRFALACCDAFAAGGSPAGEVLLSDLETMA